MASTMFGTAAPLQSFATQRTRNNSGGSTGSSVSSMDSDLSTPMTPLTPTTPAFGAAPSGLQVQDYQTIANMLSQNTAMHTEQVVKSLASRYKTELCRSYSETGICKYGDKCQFAHGGTEVKCLPRHPKYKSELCRTFHTSGFCPYGPRCHFIHSEDESKLTEINLMKQQAAARQATQQMMQQAARLRAQQQALQQQMQTLVLSQLHIQMAQKQLTPSPITTQRPMFFPQMSVPVPQTQQMSTAAAAAMIRKAALERTVSMPSTSAYSNLGSVIDTPPITPPCGSPTFNVTSSNTTNFATTSTTRVVPPPPGFPAKPMNVAVSSMEKFPTTSACVNLDFGSNQNDLLANDVNDILSRLNSMELESLSSQSEMYTPSTSPDSVQSPLDSPRCGRLPVFSQFSDLQ